MLVRVAAQIRASTSFHSIAHCVIAELASRGLRSALVLCDAAGEPALWIGDFERAIAQAYLDGGFREDALFAAICARFVAASEPGLWVGPILGNDGVIGMLRVATHAADTSELTMIAAYISIRIALLGLTLDHVRTLDTLTRRQREVAELVAHGCTNVEIGDMLRISSNAVKKHVSRVLSLLDVTNRTELAGLTGRWRIPTESDRTLPPTIHVVLRNPSKSIATDCPEEVA